MKKIIALILALISLTFSFAACAEDDHDHDHGVPTVPKGDETIGQKDTEGFLAYSPRPALEFTVYDGDGKEIKLADYKDKILVINFWATWCEPCLAEMDNFQSAYDLHKDEVEFLMINVGEPAETAKAFIESKGYTFPVAFDTDGITAISYNVDVIPMTYFIDKNGTLMCRIRGVATPEVLAQGIKAVKEATETE